MAITEQKIRNKLFLLVVFLILNACADNQPPKGAYWNGDADFMHITSDQMHMIYSVDVIGQKIFLDGFYEIIRKNTDKIIYKLEVKELEFGRKQDGTPFCRAWGYIDASSIQSYLYVQDCHPVH